MIGRLLTKAAIMTILLVTVGHAYAQACSPGTAVLTSQEMVDNFQDDFGPCDRIGGLTVQGPDIVNLDGLAGLVEVSGDLKIEGNGALTNLDGLSDLQSVGNRLNISSNPVLANLDGLAGLQSVRSFFELYNNASVTDLDGLRSLRTLLTFNIRYNQSLTSIAGLSSLAGGNMTLRFYGNRSLTHLTGLEHLEQLRSLWFEFTAISDLSGLSGLRKIDGELTVQINQKLESLNGLDSIESIGTVRIVGNSVISNLAALNSLTLLRELVIGSNASLAKLAGLSSLIEVMENITVQENRSLADCSALEKVLDKVDHGDPGPGPAGMPDVGGIVKFRDNLPGCNSELEILDPDAPPFAMSPALNDAWYNVLTDGQGFFITVYPEAESIAIAWFSFETEDRPDEPPPAKLGEPYHRWLTAVGNWQGTRAVLDVVMSTGGVFDNPAEVTHTEEGSYGTIWIVFHSCNSATLTYELYSNVTGSIPLERVVNDNVAQCEDWAEYF